MPRFCCVAISLLCAGLLTAQDSQALLDAVRGDEPAAVAALLKKRANPNARDDEGGTALSWAALRCNVEIARLLLEAGADPNLTNEQGVGPLALAIENGAPEIVKLLLKRANPNLPRADGETPLMTAVRLGQIDVVRLLLARGADVNARQTQFGQTALMWAAGRPEIVRLLLQHRADPRAVTKTWNITSTIYTPTTVTLGKTGIPWNNDGVYTSKEGGQDALLFAVQAHDLDSARQLLDAGVDVNRQAADGATPLLAALYKFDPVGKEFVAGTGAPAPAGSSARFGGDVAMANLLLDRGASFQATDSAGYTPLHGAVLTASTISMSNSRDRSAYGHGRTKAASENPLPPAEAEKLKAALALVKRLLDLGADPNRQTLYPTQGPVGDVRINPAPPGSSPFHLAADSDCLELVQLFIEHGANPNLVRKDGHTPFSVAVLSRDIPVVDALVKHGADLHLRYNPKDHFSDPVKPISLPRDNQTIMHIAAGANAPEMVEYLHQHGVGFEDRNSAGETPLELADHQERYREARDKEGAEDHPERKIVRDTATTAMIKKLL